MQLIRAVAELSVVKLGQLVGRDQRIIRLMEAADSKLITMGADSASVDWPEMWSQRLNIPMELLTVRSEGTAEQVWGDPPILIYNHTYRSAALFRASCLLLM